MVRTILGAIKRHGHAYLQRMHRWLLRQTTPTTLARGAVTDAAKSKAALMVENALLRQQLIVLQRQVARPAFTPRDRVLLVLLARLVQGWRAALLIVQPETLLRWHRQDYRLVWRVRSATATTRPRISEETVALIKRMAAENRLWGAERMRGEFLKRGVRVGKRTVQRHRRGVCPPHPSRQTWACDVLPVIDGGFRTLFAFFIVDLGSRRVVHVGVTRHPTDAWVAPHLREATPFGLAPRFLIRDNDATFDAQFARVAAGSHIEVLRTPVRAPRANAICERFLGGSVRTQNQGWSQDGWSGILLLL